MGDLDGIKLSPLFNRGWVLFCNAQEMGDLDGITCFCELAVPLASRLCERLGLPTNSPQVSLECSLSARGVPEVTRVRWAVAWACTPTHCRSVRSACWAIVKGGEGGRLACPANGRA